MSRVPSLSSPFLLGFDEIERVLDRVAKGSDGYPPYNIERVGRDGTRIRSGCGSRWRWPASPAISSMCSSRKANW